MQVREPKVYRLSDYKKIAYLVTHVDLTIDLTQEPVRVKSVLAIRPNPDCASHPVDLMLDGENMRLISIKLNDKPLAASDYVLTDTALTVKNVPQDTSFTLESETQLGNNTDLFGLYKTEGTCLVKAETQGLRRVFYCNDRPDNLATYNTTIIAKKAQYPTLLSNGKLIRAEELADGVHAVTWEDTFPKPSYLFALVAGNLQKSVTHFTTQSGRDLPIEFYVSEAAVAKCGFAKDILKKAMKWDEDTYGLEYALPQHMVAGVDQYASGASEPTGLNLFNTEYLFATRAIKTDYGILTVAEVVSHELFHYLSGDTVTIRDWFQLALKEGLTTFRAAMFREALFGSDIIRLLDGHRGSPLDAEDAPRPDSYTAVRSLYTGAAYEKSAEIFRMIMCSLGEKVFYAGMNKFFRDYAGKAATIEDLLTSLGNSSATNLSPYLAWFSEAGAPQLTVTDEYDATTKHYILKVKTAAGKARPIPITLGLLDKQGNEVQASKTVVVDQPEMEVHFDNISSHPVPSLLRGFSAPAKLSYDYNKEDLLLLMRYDTDIYNRCQAAHKLICMLISDYCHGKKIELPAEFFETYRALLADKSINPWVLAEIIALPTEENLIKEIKNPSLDKISEGRKLIVDQLANKIFAELQQRLNDLNSQADVTDPQFADFDMRDAAKRRLKETCLTYLSHVEPVKIKQLAIQQFNAALGNNMNETMTALSLLCEMDCPESKEALDKFYQCWHEDTNAINYWFRIQASAHTSTTVARVQELMTHPAFDIANPNKVRALFGPFTLNPYGFHAISGEGYQLITKLILTLDKKNPALAASMAAKFNDWDKYDIARQTMMYDQLTLLDNTNVSINVKDSVKKNLAKGKPVGKSRSAEQLLSWMTQQAVVTSANEISAHKNTPSMTVH